MFNKLKKSIKNPRLLLIYILGFKIFRLIPDSMFLKIKYNLIMDEKLDLNNPKKFNEKLQWLKLYDRKAEYSLIVDKYEVRKYITEKIGDEYLIPLLGVWDKFEDIDFDKLPNEFVLKPNHTSGNVFICKDKSKINYKELKKEVNRWMKRKYYWVHREWPYKNIKPKIICEKLLKSDENKLPYDYKFHCFNGKPDNVMVCIDRETGSPKFYFFNEEWDLLKYNIAGINAPKNFTLEKPCKLNEMFEIARKLSNDFPFVRVDLYYVNEKIYFGELTLYPQSGFDKNLLKDTDIYFGKKIILN